MSPALLPKDDVEPAKKFCRDCKHIVLAKALANSQCGHEKGLKYSIAEVEFLVTGVPPAIGRYFCETMRDSVGECGPEGKLWEAKDANPG